MYEKICNHDDNCFCKFCNTLNGVSNVIETFEQFDWYPTSPCSFILLFLLISYYYYQITVAKCLNVRMSFRWCAVTFWQNRGNDYVKACADYNTVSFWLRDWAPTAWRGIVEWLFSLKNMIIGQLCFLGQGMHCCERSAELVCWQVSPSTYSTSITGRRHHLSRSVMKA